MAIRLRDTDFFLPFRLGPTAAGTLQEFIDIDVTAKDLVRLLQANRAYQNFFADFVQHKIERRGVPAPETASPTADRPRITTYRLVNLLGLVGSRNLLLTIRLHEAVLGTVPVNEEGSFTEKPAAHLKYALRAEDFFQRNDREYPETAFAGGLLFDWIAAWAKKNGQGKSLQPFFEDSWKEAQRTGLLAYELAKRVPGLNAKHLLAAGLLLPAGRLLQAANEPSFLEFWKRTRADRRLDSLARLTLERESFGFASEEISAYLLNFFTVFRELRPVLRHHREPFVLKGPDLLHYREAHLLLLAETMALSWRAPSSPEDALWAEWAPASRDALALTQPATEAALRAAMETR